MPLNVRRFSPLVFVFAIALSGCAGRRSYISLSEAEKSALPTNEGTAVFSPSSPRSMGFGGSCPLPSKVGGEANVLVVPLEYDDQVFNAADYDGLFNSFGGDPLLPSSVKEYFKIESKGQFVPNFVFARPIDLSGISLPDKSQSERCSYLFSHYLRSYIGTDEAPYPLSLFDADSDGLYDGVIFLDTKKDNPFLGGCFTVDGAGDRDCAVSGYACVSPYYYHYDSPARTLSFVAHEMGHLMGLPDTYAGAEGRHPMGHFSLMEAMPGEIVPFEKILLGWEEPREIDQRSGRISLKPGESVLYKCPDDNGLPFSRCISFECVDPSKQFFAYPGWHFVKKPGILVTRIDARAENDGRFLYSNKGVGIDENSNPFMNLIGKTRGHYNDLVTQDVEPWHILSDGDDAFFLAGDSFNSDGKAAFADGTMINITCAVAEDNDGVFLTF